MNNTTCEQLGVDAVAVHVFSTYLKKDPLPPCDIRCDPACFSHADCVERSNLFGYSHRGQL